jgi:hypothetical protein
MSSKPVNPARLIGLFLLGVVLFNYPLLPLWSGRGTLIGIPALYFYIFAAWAVLIALIAAVVEGSRAR